MRVFFRVDASIRIGTGHVVRCLVLADMLRSQGAEPLFVCRALEGHLAAMVEARGFPVVVLPAPAGGDVAGALDVHEDAVATIEAVGGVVPDWWIVDHYELDARWEHQQRRLGSKLLAIDDIASRSHDCDIVLDQNYFADSEKRYAALVPPTSRRLFGPAYALLRPEYAQHRATVTARREPLERILIFFGGSDPDNLTELALAALSTPALRHIAVDVVVGVNYGEHRSLERCGAQRGRTTIHGARPHLADLMARADIALGAGGATTWERMCLGVSSLVVITAPNQESVTASLDREDLIRFVGRSGSVTTEDIISALLDDMETRRWQVRSEKTMRVCDGLGTARVAEALWADTAAPAVLYPEMAMVPRTHTTL